MNLTLTPSGHLLLIDALCGEMSAALLTGMDDEALLRIVAPDPEKAGI